MSTEGLLPEAMYLCWVITCSRCKIDEMVDHPDDMGVAIRQLLDQGWTASQVEPRNKALLATMMDVSSWPDTVTRILCPQCSEETGHGPQ